VLRSRGGDRRAGERRLLLNVAREDGARWRERLTDARVMLVFTPEVCGAASAATGAAMRPALERLDAALPAVDVVQVRPKRIGSNGRTALTAACEAFAWTERVLALAGAGDDAPLVIVNDRVDVAAALAASGCAGVHVGDGDCPAVIARSFLGPAPLIGTSTHAPADVARASEEPLDYVGFGPIWPTDTKGYERGLGPEAAWIAHSASSVPLFAIGGVDATNVDQLAQVGRVAVGAAILASDDPGHAAREVRALLDEASLA